jgi:hypothetical protein
MNSQTSENQVFGGRRLVAARILWMIFALTLTLLQIASQVALFRALPGIQLTQGQVSSLHAMGLSPEMYYVWRSLWTVPSPLVWGGLGLLIFLRKSDDRGALVISAMMVAVGMAANIPPWQAFAAAHPAWVWVVPIAAFLGNLCINSFFFVFPTGRFIPRWTVGVTVAASAYNILNSYAFALPPALVALGKSVDWFFPIFALVSLVAFIGAPIYRYRRVSTALEQQQIKWVVFTIAFAFSVFALTASTVFWAPGGNPDRDISLITVFVQPIGWDAALLLIPLSIAISILRYRLFDIDILVRRTLTYAIVTALLATVFFGSVILLQQLFSGVTGAGQNEIVTVLSTLVIAALFIPVRNRIQTEIDRRFNRNKYNAQQVLNDFANTVRDETNLENLTARLMQVVDETMQPRSVSVWLKKEPRGHE